MSKGVVWDLTSYFNSFNSPEMQQFKKEMNAMIGKMQAESGALGTLSKGNLEQWEKLLLDFEQLTRRLSHYGSYVGCLHSADANNEEYGKESAETDSIGAEFSKIVINLKMGLKNADNADFVTFCQREKLADISFHLGELREEAQKTMSSELENLAADLSVDGFSSWDRLYNVLAGKLCFDMHWPDGRVEKTPMAQCRSLMQDSEHSSMATRPGSRLKTSVLPRSMRFQAPDFCLTAAAALIIFSTYRSCSHAFRVRLSMPCLMP